jgi:ATP adenylyltransferase
MARSRILVVGHTLVKYEQLWAPWRLGYILGEKGEAQPTGQGLQFPPDADSECFICQAVADPVARDRHVVHRDELVISLLNRYPYNNGHLLVAPNAHRPEMHQLSDAQHLAVAHEATRMIRLLQQVLSPEGFNVGLNLGRAAGAGLPSHLHWHIVPRWNGDTNFMPALAAVKVIPQSLDALWQLLTEELTRQS